jgi:hypothetical protein
VYFHDFSHKYRWILAQRVADHLEAHPDLLDAGRQYLDRHIKPDPGMRPYYRIWNDAIRRGPFTVANCLRMEGESGDRYRESMPVFVVFPDEIRKEIADEAARL